MYAYWRFALSLVVLSVNVSSAQTPVVSDPQALSLAQKSVAALVGSASIADAQLQGNVISIVGADSESGTGTFQAKGAAESRVDLNLGKEVRSDVRSMGNGFPGGAWKRDASAAQKYATHNCWTDAAWFFPALSTLAQTANPSFVFSYLGQQKRAALVVEHLRVYQQGLGPVPQLSTMDFYLDAVSLLPLTIAFQQHPDNDLLTNIPVEINFANYKAVNGIQVPFHFQRSYNGGVDLDVTVTNAAVNTGISDSTFSLQ
jgi:hypothetical protein